MEQSNVSDSSSLISEEQLFKELGLRHLVSFQLPTGLHFTGLVLVILSALVLLTSLYTIVISKLMPYTGILVLDFVKDDEYFCYLLPLLVLPTFSVVYLNWLAMNHFQQN
eukprot:gene39148-47630_t